MHSKNRKKLASRVAKTAEASLSARRYVAPVDVLVGMGWLDRKALARWRLGQVDYLERVVGANLSRISKAMKLFRSWASARALVPRETHYGRRSHRLRFSKSGHPSLEQMYRTHWVSPTLIEAKRANKKANGHHDERCRLTPSEAPPIEELQERVGADMAVAP